MGLKRLEGESFEHYKEWRQEENKLINTYLLGRNVKYTEKEVAKLCPTAK